MVCMTDAISQRISHSTATDAVLGQLPSARLDRPSSHRRPRRRPRHRPLRRYASTCSPAISDGVCAICGNLRRLKPSAEAVQEGLYKNHMPSETVCQTASRGLRRINFHRGTPYGGGKQCSGTAGRSYTLKSGLGRPHTGRQLP